MRTEQPRFTLVAGTHAYDGTLTSAQWYHPESLFAQRVMKPYGARPARSTPFIWSTDLDGFLGARNHAHIDWKSGGWALKYYFGNVPLRHRNIVAHSFGGCLVAYALTHGLQINNLITVGTPVRKDMDPVWAQGAEHIRGNWLHLADRQSDWMARLGQLFDGRLGWRYDMPAPAVNVTLPKGLGHSRILNEPPAMALWFSQGWLDALFEEHP